MILIIMLRKTNNEGHDQTNDEGHDKTMKAMVKQKMNTMMKLMIRLIADNQVKQ